MIEAPQSPTLAGTLIIITAIIWFFVELYVLFYKKQTISNAMYNFATKMPIIPFMIGMLFGHWFW